VLDVFIIVTGSTLSYKKDAKMFWMTHFTVTWFYPAGYVNPQNLRLWPQKTGMHFTTLLGTTGKFGRGLPFPEGESSTRVSPIK
jgi:hypothetical protein